jgi:hypothetical protein
MQRYAILLLLLLLGFSLLTFVVWAQDETPAGRLAPLTVAQPPAQMLPVRGVWQPLELQQVDLSQLPFTPDAPPATDTCSAAPLLVLPDGGQTIVNNMTVAAEDPVLACMWGAPSSNKGYRTVWYQFEAPSNGQVVIDTTGSTYDTVLAVYTGSCTSLAQLACNDDSQGFTSRIALTVSKDVTYYIEAADWSQGTTGPETLNISAIIEPVESQWLQSAIMPLPRTRHAAVVVGAYIYVLGGIEANLNGTPDISERVDRFNTVTGAWDDSPADMPGSGYANTTAAYVSGRIYLPNGYNGNNTTFDNTHWVYDIAANFWFTQAPIPGEAFAWATAVVPPAQDGYYLAGGLSNPSPVTTTLQVRDELLFYQPSSNTWLGNFPPMSAPRYAHTGAWVAGRVCVAGGISSGNVLLTNGECYAPGSGGWAPTGEMNYPRYAAGSGVGPDGKWYVFGGVNATGDAIAVTEVYNPATNTWTALNPAYDLGGSLAVPARAWPRGGFVGSTLWAIGGNTAPDNDIVPLVEKLFIPPIAALLPYKGKSGVDPGDNTLAQARPLGLNQPQQHNFDSSEDVFDVFFFDVPTLRAVTVRLTKIPSDSNYDIAIYNANKLLWGKGDNPGLGLDEVVTLTLAPGRYYIVVQRVFPVTFPNTANYQIAAEG